MPRCISTSWPYTSWFGLSDDGGIKAVALLYAGAELPVLLALGPAESEHHAELLRSLLHLLPARFYCHLTPGLEAVLNTAYRLESHGRHLKMTLAGPGSPGTVDTRGAERLQPQDEPDLIAFYADCYPGNWFDPRMLASGEYFAIRQNGRIASVAGIHVYSKTHRVAALGNIATRVELRGQGLGRAVTAALCQDLLKTTDTIGLNVKADNAPAVRCYQQLGFTKNAEYDEYMAVRA
jgi:ribosomal protein S18 acetylase RimI-like enzyme